MVMVLGVFPKESNRSFGYLFVGVFWALSVYAVIEQKKLIALGWFLAGLALLFISFFSPFILTPFNRAWMKLGDLMGKVVSPLVLGIIFFVLITPVAVITRLFGRDELRLKRTNAQSYWIDRASPGPVGDSFKNQF